jgi:hypothetical protein
VKRFLRRGDTAPDDVLERAELAGEKVLATAETTDGSWLFGTRDALVVVDPVESRRIPWEQVESADWQQDSETLRVVEVAPYGERRPVHTLGLSDAGLFLALVRERVTASVVLARRVPLGRGKGLTVVGRRPPRGTGDITWAYELDPGVDPADPAVRAAAEEALRTARTDVGLE